jgi:hypothetical protein
MNQQDDVDLANTEKVTGQLLPVLVNKKGEIIDGRHRLRANKNWKRTELDLDPLQTHVARLVVNTQRRVANDDDYVELAEFLEGGGSAIMAVSQRITELTGIPNSTVRRHLEGTKYVVSGKKKPLAKDGVVAVPKIIADPISKTIDDLQEIVAADPEKKDEIVKRFCDGLSIATILSKPRKGKSKIPPENEPDGYAFFKKLGKWCTAGMFLDKVPLAMAIQVVRDMPKEQKEGFVRLAKIVVNNIEKLRKIVEEAA